MPNAPVLRGLLRCCGYGAALCLATSVVQAQENTRCVDVVRPNGQPGVQCVIPQSARGNLALQSQPSLRNDQDREAVRQQLYSNIMSYVRGQKIRWGRLGGLDFAPTYRAATLPKALAVCVDWDSSTPTRLNLQGQGNFQFVTGAGTCEPKTKAQAIQCVVKECQENASGASGSTCTVVDVSDGNALVLPPSWLRRFSQ